MNAVGSFGVATLKGPKPTLIRSCNNVSKNAIFFFLFFGHGLFLIPVFLVFLENALSLCFVSLFELIHSLGFALFVEKFMKT